MDTVQRVVAEWYDDVSQFTSYRNWLQWYKFCFSTYPQIPTILMRPYLSIDDSTQFLFNSAGGGGGHSVAYQPLWYDNMQSFFLGDWPLMHSFNRFTIQRGSWMSVMLYVCISIFIITQLFGDISSKKLVEAYSTGLLPVGLCMLHDRRTYGVWLVAGGPQQNRHPARIWFHRRGRMTTQICLECGA